LISNFTILTAASCLLKVDDGNDFYDENELSVAMGSLDLNDNNKDSTLYLKVVAVKIHGRFNKRTLANNLALLKVLFYNGNSNKTFLILNFSSFFTILIG
jgi:hypothetical protein